MGDTGGGIRLPYTAAGTIDGGGTLTRLVLTATGIAVSGSVVDGQATREAYTATGTTPSVNDATGAPSRQAYTAFGFSPPVNNATRELYTATGIALNGGIGSGIATRLAYTASGIAIPGGLASGAPVLQARTASGVGLNGGSGAGSLVLQARTAAGTGISGTVGAGSLVLQVRTASGVGINSTPASGSMVAPRRVAYGIGAPAVDTTIRTWVMNTRHNAVTQYVAYPYNSFARYNGVYLGAGPTGLFILENGADDAGTPISWEARTGMHDDKDPGLKRLPEVLAGIRYDGPITVTVYKDELVSYDYALANYRPKYELHQARAKTGKGLRSRYFQVGLKGTGTKAEIESLQMPMTKTTRRVG